MRGLALTVVLVLFAASGCGYSIVRYSGGIGDVRSVAVVTPSNASYEPGIERLVADALRREFLKRGAVRLIENPSAADLVLDGRVLPVRGQAQSFTSTVVALEVEVTLALDLAATRRDGADVPIDARALYETERYLASADAEAMRKNREEALRRASQVLAGRVYDALYATLAP